jgi:hypothetical protein
VVQVPRAWTMVGENWNQVGGGKHEGVSELVSLSFVCEGNSTHERLRVDRLRNSDVYTHVAPGLVVAEGNSNLLP